MNFPFKDLRTRWLEMLQCPRNSWITTFWNWRSKLQAGEFPFVEKKAGEIQLDKGFESEYSLMIGSHEGTAHFLFSLIEIFFFYFR